MEKLAKTAYPIHDLLQRRWSPRAFTGEDLEWETVIKLLEAARWAPSSSNSQPWRFIVAMRDEVEAFNQIFSCLKGTNQRWAGEAAVLMIITAHVREAAGEAIKPIHYYNTGLAMAQMTVEAMANGLFVHQMAGIERDKIRDIFNLPAEFDAIAAVAIGHLGSADNLPDDLRERERKERMRKPLGEIAFDGAWGVPVMPE